MNSIILILSQSTATQAGNYFALISQASAVVKFVLLFLLVFSVLSWAIVIFKLVEYRNARMNSEKFLEFFRKNRNLSDIYKFLSNFKDNPLSRIFKAGYRELSSQLSGENKTVNIRLLERSVMNTSNSEIVKLEKLNGFLATTAAVSPFIGLFGTVWGIMSSFHQIGIQMNANLATVAPGIAEALIATALGLFAAIPAVIFYNLLLNKLKVLISHMEIFMGEFLNSSENLNRR